MTYINFVKSEFSKEKLDEANKLAIDESGDPDGKTMLRFDLEDTPRIEEIKEDGTIDIVSENKLGFISLDLRLSDENILDLISVMVKRLNKFKAVLEGLK